jgi:hypothetical protein
LYGKLNVLVRCHKAFLGHQHRHACLIHHKSDKIATKFCPELPLIFILDGLPLCLQLAEGRVMMSDALRQRGESLFQLSSSVCSLKKVSHDRIDVGSYMTLSLPLAAAFIMPCRLGRSTNNTALPGNGNPVREWQP